MTCRGSGELREGIRGEREVREGLQGPEEKKEGPFFFSQELRYKRDPQGHFLRRELPSVVWKKCVCECVSRWEEVGPQTVKLLGLSAAPPSEQLEPQEHHLLPQPCPCS